LTTDQLSPTVGKLSIIPPPEWQLQRHFPKTLKPSDVMAKFKGRYVVSEEHGVRRETFTGIQIVMTKRTHHAFIHASRHSMINKTFKEVR